jgi:hypothetical protein
MRWLIASVVNDPLGTPDSTPLYAFLPPIWGAADGDHLIPHYSWDHSGNKEEILQQRGGGGAESSSAASSGPVATSKPAVEISPKVRDEPMVRNLLKVKPKTPFLGVSSTTAGS